MKMDLLNVLLMISLIGATVSSMEAQTVIEEATKIYHSSKNRQHQPGKVRFLKDTSKSIAVKTVD